MITIFVGHLLKKRKKIYLIFLGAGASIPTGFPGSLKLLTDFEDELKKSHESDKTLMVRKMGWIKKKILSNNFDYDSESLYSCLQGYSNPSRFIRQAGPFPSALCKIQPISRAKPDRICVKLRSLFEEYLISRYYDVSPFVKLKIKTMYNRFFSKASGVADWKNSGPDWETSNFEIFTTNYDYVLETYSEQVNQSCCVGYRIAQDGRVIFTPEEYEKNKSPLKIHKLHGSVELSLLDNNQVISQLPPRMPGETYDGKRIVSKVMVYGIQKNLIAEPHFDLLSLFKKRLAKLKKCLVVGYSFRDPWVNQIIHDVVKNHRGLIRIEFIGVKSHTRIPKLPLIKKVVTKIARNLESYLELPSS